MQVIVDHVGNSGGRTGLQCTPASVVTYTNPSSEPVQMTLSLSGEKAIEEMVSNISSPVTSALIGPPWPPLPALVVACEVWTDHFPVDTFIEGFKQHVRSHQQFFRVAGRKHNRMMNPTIAILDFGPGKTKLVFGHGLTLVINPVRRFSFHSML